MKIAILVSDADSATGYGRYTIDVATHLPAQGIEPIVFAPTGERGRPPEVLKVEYHQVLVPLPGSGARLTLRALLRDTLHLMRTCRGVDAVWVFSEALLPVGFLVARYLGIPLVSTAHGTYAVNGLSGRVGWLRWLAYRYAAVVFAVSSYTAERLRARQPTLESRLKVVNNGVTRPESWVVTPASKRRPEFLMVGAVKERKGILDVVRALSLVKQRHPNVHLHIAGRLDAHEFVDKVRAEVMSLKLQANIDLMGKVEENRLNELYRSVRGLLLPARSTDDAFEGFGLVLLEANARGIPTVGSRDSGTRDAVRDGETGFLVDSGSPDQIAEAMNRLLDDVTWERLSTGALRFANAMSWDKVVKNYARYLHAIADQT